MIREFHSNLDEGSGGGGGQRRRGGGGGSPSPPPGQRGRQDRPVSFSFYNKLNNLI